MYLAKLLMVCVAFGLSLALQGCSPSTDEGEHKPGVTWLYLRGGMIGIDRPEGAR